MQPAGTFNALYNLVPSNATYIRNNQPLINKHFGMMAL